MLGNLSKAEKEKIDHKKLDDLESDILEGFISSNESISEFEAEDDEEAKKNSALQKKNKKLKKLKKDKRATLTKSKVNLKQMLYDMEKKQMTNASRGINYLTATAGPAKTPLQVPICSVCFEPSRYACPRCLDRYCGEDCFRNHKEFICAHLEYNYYM